MMGPPIRNQNTYTFGFNRFVSMPLPKAFLFDKGSNIIAIEGGSILKHSTPILNMNAAPKIEITIRTAGLSAINDAKKKLTIMRGPSVNIGAVAV